MPNNLPDFFLDTFFWVAMTALPASLISRLLREPIYAFAAGAAFMLALLVLLAAAKFRPNLRPVIAVRLGQIFLGVALGVLA